METKEKKTQKQLATQKAKLCKDFNQFKDEVNSKHNTIIKELDQLITNLEISIKEIKKSKNNSRVLADKMILSYGDEICQNTSITLKSLLTITNI